MAGMSENGPRGAMTRTRQLLLDALGLASLALLSGGCILRDIIEFTEALPTVLFFLFLLAFAVFVGPLSLLGIGFAVRHLAQRRPRSSRHVMFSAPFALVAIGLHAIVTNGFLGVHQRDVQRAWRWWPGGVHP